MKFKPIALALLICAIWLLSGCQTQRARQQQAGREYAQELNSLIAGYAADTLAINAKYARASAPLSRKGKLAKLADKITENAKLDARLAGRLNSLKPPPSQAQIHGAMVDFFESSSQEDSRWAAAIRSGDTKAADRASQEIDRANMRYFDQMQKLGVKFPAWSRSLFVN